METLALMDQSRQGGSCICSLQAVKPRIIKKSLGDRSSFSLATEYYSSTLFIIDIPDKRPVVC